MCQKDSRNPPLWLTAGVGGKQWQCVTQTVEAPPIDARAPPPLALTRLPFSWLWLGFYCVFAAAGMSIR